MASQYPPVKSAAFTLFFTLYKNDGTVVANPGTYTKKRIIDGGSVGDIAASVTEEDTTYGCCSVILSAEDMAGDAIWVYITDDTAGTVPFTCTLYTTAYSNDVLGAQAVTAAAYAIINSGLAFRGVVTSKVGCGDNDFIVGTLIGVGAGAFFDATAPYRVFVFNDAGGAGAAPQGETQSVTAYNSTTGKFTTSAFTAPVVVGDTVILMHPRIAELAAIKAETALIVADTNELQTDWTDGGRLDLLLDAVTAGAGTGAVTWTYTVTDSDGGAAIPGVHVWVTSDVGGETLIASGDTGATGVVTVYLDAGTYYFWCHKPGYDFVNPDTEVVA